MTLKKHNKLEYCLNLNKKIRKKKFYDKINKFIKKNE